MHCGVRTGPARTVFSPSSCGATASRWTSLRCAPPGAMRAGGHRSHRIASDPSHRAVRWQALLVLPCTRLRPYVDLLDAVERSAMERRDWWLGAAPAIEGFHVHDAIEARTASDDAPVPAPAPVCEEQRAAPVAARGVRRHTRISCASRSPPPASLLRSRRGRSVEGCCSAACCLCGVSCRHGTSACVSVSVIV